MSDEKKPRRVPWRDALGAMPPVSKALLAAPVVLVVAALLWLSQVLGPALSREQTLEHAAGSRVVLQQSLDYTWDYVTELVTSPDSQAAEERRERYLAADIPAPLCQLGDVQPDPEVARLVAALATIRPAAGEPVSKVRLRFSNELASLRGLRPVGVADRFLRSYSLARVDLILDNPGGAVGEVAILTSLAREFGPAYVEKRDRSYAIERYRRGEVADWQVALSFFAHYTAGLALHRSSADPDEAIREFRRALNPLLYRLEPDQVDAGHASRVEVPQRAFECAPPQGREGWKQLTSLDAYVGLVAAYWDDRSFRDVPGSLAETLARLRPTAGHDPAMRPLLEHGYGQSQRRRAGGIPENVLWAAANLSEVHLHNRNDPDQRIETSRAVLVLATLREWPTAVSADTGGGACSLLDAVLTDLRSPGNPMWTRDEGTSVDSLFAGVALEVRAAQRHAGPEAQPCPSPADVQDRQVRSAMLRLSGNFIAGGMASRFEHLRTRMEQALEQPNGGVAALVREAERAAERVDVGPDGDPANQGRARSFIRGWWREVFADAALGIGRNVDAQDGAPTAREAAARLDALHSAIVYAGLRPHRVYAYGEFRSLASRAGSFPRLAYTARYRTLSPGPGDVAWMAGVGALVLLLLVACAWGSLVWWRFRLVTGSRFREEHRRRRSKGRRRWGSQPPTALPPPPRARP